MPMPGFLRRLDFLMHRPWSRLWLGLPAIGFVVVALYFYLSQGGAQAQTPESVIKRAKVEMSQNRPKEAAILLERYLNSNENTPEVQHAFAEVLITQGQVDRAVAILRKTAPENEIGHIPSQLLLCNIALLNPRISPIEMKIVETRLSRILSERRDHDETKGVFVTYHIRAAGMTESQEEREAHIRKGIEYLNDLAGNRRPWLGQKLGELYMAVNDETSGKRWFQTSSQYFKGLVGAGSDNHMARIAWAKAELYQKNYDEAFKILEPGVASAASGAGFTKGEAESNDAFSKRKADQVLLYQVLMGDVRAAQVEDLKTNDPKNIKDRIAKLNQGLEYNPKNQVLLRNLIELTDSDTPEAAELVEKIRELQVNGANNSSLHYVLGVSAYLKDKKDQAKFHFERALEIDPAAPIVANNLAYMLSQGEKPDLPRARELIDAAITKRADIPQLIDTRGVIRVKQGEYKEGIKDLELVTQNLGSSLERHEMLALAYEKLGQSDTAQLHRKKAATMKAQQERTNGKDRNNRNGGLILPGAANDPDSKALGTPNDIPVSKAKPKTNTNSNANSNATPAPTTKKAASPNPATKPAVKNPSPNRGTDAKPAASTTTKTGAGTSNNR